MRKVKIQHKKLKPKFSFTMKEFVLVGQAFVQLAILFRVNSIIEKTDASIKQTLVSIENLNQLNEKFLLEFSGLVSKSFSIKSSEDAALINAKLVEHEKVFP